MDESYASSTVAERVVMASDHEAATYDPSPTVRVARAQARGLTEEERDTLAEDERPQVRAALAANPGTDSITLDGLADDEDRRVREAVARHPAAPPEALERMAGDLDRRRDLPLARRIAANPHTPGEALKAWIASGAGGQRVIAQAALRRRAEAAAETASGAVLAGADRLGAEMEAGMDVAASGAEEALGGRPVPRRRHAQPLGEQATA